MTPRVPGRAGAVLAAALAAWAPALASGCAPSRRAAEPAAPPADVVDAGPGNRPYFAGTPAQRRLAEDLVARIGVETGEALLALDAKILRVGEPAIPPLLRALASDDARVRAQAAYLLGATRDRRTLEPLAAATRDPVPVVRYEAGAGLLEMGDDRGADVLIGGLSDPDARLRAKSADVLAATAGTRFGYEPDDPPAEREEAVRRWRAWSARRRAGP
jgi:hypothetical protein